MPSQSVVPKSPNQEQIEALRNLNLPLSQISITRGDSIPFSITWSSGKQRFDYTVTWSDRGRLILVNGESGSGAASDSDAENSNRGNDINFSVTRDVSLECDTKADELAEHMKAFCLSPLALSHFLSWHQSELDGPATNETDKRIADLCAFLICQKNVKASVLGFMYALGMQALMGNTMRKTAGECLMTAANISKATKAASAFLNGHRSRYMKSARAAESYSIARKQNHWRFQHGKGNRAKAA